MRSLLCWIALALGCKGQETAAPTPAPSTTSVASVPAASASADASAPALGGGNSGGRTTYTFDKDIVGSVPALFKAAKTGQGRDGNWSVRAEADAPSAPNVVAQTDTDPTDNRFPILFADVAPLADVSVSVRCKPVSGKVDQACGLVARFYDANNYYLVRANALENNVRLYVVKDGKRQQLASWSGKVTSGEWHKLYMVITGNHFAVKWDDAKVIDHTDATFSGAGKVGVWTKADSVTYFDDLQFGPLTN